MTTLAKLDKLAAEWFTPQMEKAGFRKIKRGYYVRERLPLHDVVFWDILRSGESLRVYVSCWTPAGYSKEELSRYPECISVVLGSPITETGFDRGVWTIGNDDLERSVLRELFESLKKHAFPWFESIQTADDYLEKFRWMRDINRDFRERVKAELPSLFVKPGSNEKGSE